LLTSGFIKVYTPKVYTQLELAIANPMEAYAETIETNNGVR